jgi:hypothetical protein
MTAPGVQTKSDWRSTRPGESLRNIRDQATFDELILEAESQRGPVRGPPLSHLISNGYPIYLFYQVMQNESALLPPLFAYVFGPDPNTSDGTDFKTQYYSALMKQGMLKKDKQRFDMEKSVCLEARNILGEDHRAQYQINVCYLFGAYVIVYLHHTADI